MAQDPWADFEVVQPAQQPAPQNPDPIIRTAPDDSITPYQQQQIGLQEGREDRADRADQRGAVGEQQAYTLVSRVGGGIDDIRYVYEAWPDSQEAPSLGDTVLYGTFGPNSVWTRGLASDGRKALEDTQRDIIDALLTLGTGAAYTDEQLETYRASYFPQFKDSDKMIALKERRLRRAFEEAIPRAGPLADRLKQYQVELLGDGTAQPEAEPRQATKQDAMPLGGEFGMDRWGKPDAAFDRNEYLQERFGIDPGKETRLVGMINANIGNPELSLDMLRRIYSDAGVPPPAEADLQTMLEDMKSGAFSPTTGIDTSAAKQQYVEGLDTIIDAAGFDPESMSETAGTSGRQGSSFEFYDETVGVGNAIAEGLQGNNPIDGYIVGRDVTRRLDERGREANPITSGASRVAGAIPTGGLAAGRVSTVGQAARVGGVEAAIAGFGSGDGLAGSTGNALIAAPFGVVAGAGVQKAGNAITQTIRNRRASALTPEAPEVVRAGERQRVTVRRPDIDPSVRDARAQVQQTPEGRTAIKAASDSDLEEVETALVRGLGGNTTGRTQGGDNIQSGVRAARESLRTAAKKDYTIAARQAGEIQVDPKRALDVIDAQIEELAKNGANRNAARIKYLRDTRQDITRRGGLTVDGLRAMRTDLRSDLDNAGVYTNDFERRMNMVIDAVSDDIAGVLQRQAPEAAEAYGRADRAWRQQAKLGEDVGDLLLGRRDDLSAGQAANRVLGWAKQDPRRISRLLEEVGEGTRAEVQALVAGQLGRKTNGEFQLGAFLRETGDGSGAKINPATLRAIFGEDGVRAIRDLRILAQAKTEAGIATNSSSTGGIINNARKGLRKMLLAGFGFSAASDAGTGAGALAGSAAMLGGEIVEKLGTQRTIRLVLNPDFAKWLRQTPNTSSPNAINRHFERLRRVATRTPGMVADVKALERALVGAVNDNTPAKLAAEGQNAEEVE